MPKKILRHQDLVVYRRAIEAAMRTFEISKKFPKEETYSLTDQVRRSSRSVAANIAEAWRKRRYTMLLSLSSMTLKVRQQRPRLGWRSLFEVITCSGMWVGSSITSTTK